MGEARRKREQAVSTAVGGEETMVVDTLGGRMHVRWDEGAAATPNGQRVFFAEFLAVAGVFDRWVEACPLEYASGNAPGKRTNGMPAREGVLQPLTFAVAAGQIYGHERATASSWRASDGAARFT